MPAKPDYYKALGVSPTATPQELKAAYRLIAKKLHPDMGGSPTALSAVNEAYDVLSDPARRTEYDRERKGGSSSSSSTRRTPTPEPGPPRPKQKVSVVLCDFCDTMNRVKADPDLVPAKCAHCGRPLGKAGGDAKPPEPPKEAPKEKEPENIDSFAQILADAAGQLFGGGLPNIAKNIPGSEKVLEGLKEMADHLAKARRNAPTDPKDKAHTKLDELESYLKKIGQERSK